MTKEIWKPVPIKDYENYYEISNLGRVKSIRKNLIIKASNCRGYLIVHFSINGVVKNFSIHRLVALAFIPNPNNLSDVNHKDYNKHNNESNNLEWCTHKYNIQDMLKHYNIKRNFNKCLDCGIMLSDYKAVRCKKCHNKNKRIKCKSQLYKIDRDKLKYLIKENSMLEVGRMFNISDNAVRKWCKKFNLPYKSREIKNYTQEEWDKL